MRSLVAVLVCMSLVALPAAMRAQQPKSGLPQWTGCHGEAQVTQTDGKIDCVFAENHLYQYVRVYVRSYGGAHVARLEWIELRHANLGKDAAERIGLRDVDSLRRFYRTEYENQIVSKDEEGVERKTFITIYSGPDGFLIETLTLLPIEAAPTLGSDAPPKQAEL